VRTDFDVVVVGARVAGAMTAFHLATAGHRVLVVDRAGPPVDTLSTHLLMRTGVVQLARSGLLPRLVDARTPAITSMTLAFGGEPFTFPFRAEYGVDALYAPRRTVLDPLLLAAAAKAGADVELGRAVTGLHRDADGRIAGLVLVLGRGAGATTIRARYVVGADGKNSTVARLVDASDEMAVPPTAASVYSYFSGLEEHGFDFRYAHRASAGAFTTNDGLTLVSVGVPTADFSDPEATFDSVLAAIAPDIASEVAEAVRVERFRFTAGIASFLRTPAGPGWVLVGDAGFTKDPLSAHGISCALRDAEFAADAVIAGLESPDREASAGQRFTALRNRFAVPLLHQTAALASYEWTVSEASVLMRNLGRLSDEECAYLTGDRASDRRVA
jgi:flavin-dependent dehydrogenase